ncbi:MAG: helix-turn-helix domain-containing protein [Janthinobacterium lividum]
MTKPGMQIHPIKTEHNYRDARRRIELLMEAAPGSAEGDELDVLATLVDAYEAKHHAIDAPDPIAAIEFRMEQQGLTRKDLEPYIGTRARVSEIMTGQRMLTLPMIRRLRDELGISADLLIQAKPAERKERPGVRTKLRTRKPSVPKAPGEVRAQRAFTGIKPSR